MDAGRHEVHQGKQAPARRDIGLGFLPDTGGVALGGKLLQLCLELGQVFIGS
jgi:hypothetical protein